MPRAAASGEASMRDDQIREALERLPVPPEPPAFFNELWEKAGANDRRAVRRWRRASIAFATLAVAAATAAGVFAVGRAGGARIVDRTISCPTPTISHAVYVGASVKRINPIGIGTNRLP